MSGLIIAKKMADTPFFVSELQISLYSAEELCYYIYHYLELIEEGFVDDRLICFLRDELELVSLADKLERFYRGQGDTFQMVYIIAREIQYFNDDELNELKKRLEWRRLAGTVNQVMQKAEFLVGLKRYGDAVSLYERILDGQFGQISGKEEGRAWHNKGVALAGLFDFEQAERCFFHAYSCLKGDAVQKEAIQKEMYFLQMLSEGECVKKQSDSIKDGPEMLKQAKLLASELVLEEKRLKWKEEYEAVQEKALQSERCRQVEDAMQKDSIRKTEALSGILNQWKKEYHDMVRG